MVHLKEIKDSLMQIVFPHVCSGCGSDLLSVESTLCLRCIDALPETDFEKHADNPVEKMFWGRIDLESAAASYYFTKESLVQHLIHQLKYKKNRQLGLQLGRMMGYQLV